MKPNELPDKVIDSYLLRIKQQLDEDLPGAQVSEILAELRSHILESMRSANSTPSGDELGEVLDRLGSPEDMAEMYRTENLLEKAETSRSPWLVMRTLLRLAVKSAWALGTFLVGLIGYILAILVFICAVDKPFNPDRDGLWWNAQTHTLVGIGLIRPGPYDREILGWWIIPVGILASCLIFYLTTRFARWNIRRMRRSRKPPFTPQGTPTSSRSASGSLRRGAPGILCFCLAAVSLGSRVLAAPLPPTSATPSHYSITIVPDFDKNTFEGDEFINVHLAKATDSIQLNAAGITFENATITNGVETQTATVALDTQKEQANLSVVSAYEPGEVTMHIRYRGVIRDSCCGFYRTNAGNFRYGVMYSSARYVFPSFDNPTAKATFDIAATVDASDDAISNGRLVSDTPSTDRKYHTLKFATTPRMSTYLVTIAIGQFECEAGESDGVPIRVCGPPNEKGLGSAALEAAKFTLHFYNQYFEMKYPYGKLDFVALPGIPGAMEDVGCILAEGSAVLGRPDGGEWSKNMAIGPVAHEMAHQWLGDLVTPLSDEDAWLSEGMATWMQYKAVEASKPEWKIEMEQLLRTFAAMEVDSLRTTPPVRSLDTPDQIEYDKSAAVIRMIEAYVGPTAFRIGINSYIARYAYSNASGEELWDEITKTSKLPVDHIAQGFITEPGVPLVTVTAKCIQSKTQVDVKQDRFLSNTSNVQPTKSALWQIPVCLKLNGKTKCELLVSPEQQFVLDGCGAVFPNAGATGYYQSTYDSHDLSALGLAESSLSPEERLALLNDLWAQVRVGHVDAGAYLALTERLNSDEEPGVLKLIDNDLSYLQDYIVADSDQMSFDTWVRKTFSSRAEQAIRLSGASSMDSQSELLKIAGIIGRDSEVVGFSRNVAIDALNAGVGHPLSVSTAFEISTPIGDDSLYNKIRAALSSSKDPGERIRYIQSLARFENPRLIQSTLPMLTSAELNVAEARALRSFLFRNRLARPMVWQFLVHNWAQFQSRGLVTAGMFEDLAQFCDAPTRVEIAKFFTEHKIPEFESSLGQVSSRIKACEDIRVVQQPKLASWLEKQKVASEGNNSGRRPYADFLAADPATRG